MRLSILAILSAMTAGAVVGVAIVLSRFVMQELSAEILALLRYAIGVICMLPAVLIAKREWFAIRDIAPVAILGILQFAVLILLLNHSLDYISAARAALIFSTLPLQTMILSALFGKETLTLQKSAGILLTIIGLAVTEWHALLAGSQDGSLWIGASLAGASAFCGAVCSIFYRPYLERYQTTTVSTFAMFASVIFLLIWSFGTGTLPEVASASTPIWIAVVAVGLSSGIGYFTWLWALKHLAATTVTMFLCLGPITAAILGMLFLNELITLSFVFGLGLVISGILLALSSKDPR